MKKFFQTAFLIFPFIATAQVIQNSTDENKIFEKIEIEAGFPGGIAKWNEFVKKNFNFSRIEKSLPDSINSFSDTARVQFIVDKNGIIKDISFLQRSPQGQSSVSKSFKESCTELFKNSPHWRPANQCGRSVNAYRKETFIVQIDKSTGKRVILIRS
jgi:protein TonB